MVSLCAECMKDYPSSNTSNESRRSICSEDPISKALANLQTKIQILEGQRNEATIKLSHLSCQNFISNNNNSEYPNGNDTYNSSKSKLKSHQDSDDCVVVEKFNDVQHNIERSLANEALKMAEEKCLNLENQLSAMKRLFLRKIATKTTPKVDRKLVQIESDEDDFRQFRSLDSVDKFLSESDSDVPCQNKEIMKEKHYRKKKLGDNICSFNKIEASKSDQNPVNVSPRRMSKINCRQDGNYPFILGCSTSTSFNSAVKSQMHRKSKVQDMSFRNRSSAPFTMDGYKSASINDLTAIYGSLCDEYDRLLNKKIEIVDSLSNFNSKDLSATKSKLVEITEALYVKREQISKMRLMIKNPTTNYRNDSKIYSNLSWDN